MTDTTRAAYRAARLAEANDAIGAARDALAREWVGTQAWRDVTEELDWWIGRRAFVEAMPENDR